MIAIFIVIFFHFNSFLAANFENDINFLDLKSDANLLYIGIFRNEIYVKNHRNLDDTKFFGRFFRIIGQYKQKLEKINIEIGFVCFLSINLVE